MKPSLVILFFGFNTLLAGAQQNFSLLCEVGEEKSVSLYRDEPLVVSITLTNEAVQENQKWNRSADLYIKSLEAQYDSGKITLEEFVKEKERVLKDKRPVKADTVGSAANPWYRQIRFQVFFNDSMIKSSWPLALLGTPPEDSVAILDEEGYYVARFHLPPEKVLLLTPGKYRLKALLKNVSDEVTITIKPNKMPIPVYLSIPKQLELSRYYLDAENSSRAFGHATSILQKDPTNLEALVLRGESFILMRSYKKALADFEKALQVHQKRFPNSLEPPEYLLFRIEWLKERI
jgi:tetratricopeptide (TPR) repeat protein